MSDLVVIAGRAKTQSGKGYNKKLRRTGWIPANILEKTGTTMIEIDSKWLSKAWLGGKTFELELEGGSKKAMRIQELQIKATTRAPLHVDLMPF